MRFITPFVTAIVARILVTVIGVDGSDVTTIALFVATNSRISGVAVNLVTTNIAALSASFDGVGARIMTATFGVVNTTSIYLGLITLADILGRFGLFVTT